jgi:hypothetical protein
MPHFSLILRTSVLHSPPHLSACWSSPATTRTSPTPRRRTVTSKYSSYTEIVQKQLAHERQCHRAQQPNIPNTTRNRQQIAAQNRQTNKQRKNKQTNTRARNKKIKEENPQENIQRMTTCEKRAKNQRSRFLEAYGNKNILHT